MQHVVTGTSVLNDVGCENELKSSVVVRSVQPGGLDHRAAEEGEEE